MLDLKSLWPWGHKKNVPVKRNQTPDRYRAFRHEVDRLFDDFYSSVGSFGFPTLAGGEGWSLSVPALDVTDSDKELTISAELPGVDENDVEVVLEDDVLTIKGEKKHEHEEKEDERYYVERSYGSFSRSIRLPFDASDEDVKAEFEKGVLTIRIPKPSGLEEKVKQIEVKAHS